MLLFLKIINLIIDIYIYFCYNTYRIEKRLNMNNSIDNYLNISKKNLNTILLSLENNIEFLDNELWNDTNEFNNIITNVVNIYYDKYYLYVLNDYSKIDKYIKFNNKINRRIKNILLAIIDYYENTDDIVTLNTKESSILYLTILIYTSLILYNKDFNLISTPKQIEKVVNNIIDNFQSIRFKREKDLVKLIEDIKDIIINNNKYNNLINSMNKKDSHNMFIKINEDNELYKILYEYDIKELNNYNELDINIVNNKMNITSILSGISYDLAYVTSFKLLKEGIKKQLLFKVKKDDIIDKNIRDYMIKRNKIINDNIKFLVDYEDIKDDYDFINTIKEYNIDLYIEVNKVVDTNNYNMFMDIKKIIVPEEFLSTNEKYIEIWKDMNMEFIIKNYRNKIDEKHLLGGK
mgnify:FL=1